MIVCDICKRNPANEPFSIPMNKQYVALHDGVKILQYYKRVKADAVICESCQSKIASFIQSIEKELSK